MSQLDVKVCNSTNFNLLFNQQSIKNFVYLKHFLANFSANKICLKNTLKIFKKIEINLPTIKLKKNCSKKSQNSTGSGAFSSKICSKTFCRKFPQKVTKFEHFLKNFFIHFSKAQFIFQLSKKLSSKRS